jgi:hypothetical protein
MTIRPWHCFLPLLLLNACGDEFKPRPGSSSGPDRPVETACDDGKDNDGVGR